MSKKHVPDMDYLMDLKSKKGDKHEPHPEAPQEPHEVPTGIPHTAHERATMKKYHIRFQEQDWDALQRHFEARGISISAGIRMVVLDYIAKEGLL